MLEAWFARPGAWPLLLLAPIAAFAWWRLERARRARLAAAVGPRLARLADWRPGVAAARGGLRVALALALLLTALAALGPTAGDASEDERPAGLDVVVCLDVSRSMLARDARPNRLEAAKEEVLQLVRHAPEHRYALVLFAGEARLASPLTRDVEAFAALLAAAEPLSMRTGGSDVGGALARAARALAGTPRGGGAVLLLADGEDAAGRAAEGADELASASVALHARAYGSQRGARIPVALDGGGEAFLEDASGQPVVTRVDRRALAAWVGATGGVVADAGLVALHDAVLAPAARAVLRERRGDRRPDRFAWPLAFALALVALDLAWRPGARPAPARRGARARATTPVLAGALAVALVADGWREAQRLHEQGDHAAAYAALEVTLAERGASGDPPAELLHDLALEALLAGQLGDAREHAAALAAAPAPLATRARFVVAVADLADARLRAALALEPSSPREQLDDALARARGAFETFAGLAALALEPELEGAARRNAERALRLARELEAARAERLGEGADAPPPPTDPPPPAGEEQPPEALPPVPEAPPLPATRIDELLERLAAKDLEKRATRTAARRTAEGSAIDW